MLNHCKPICDALANLLYLDRFWCSSVLSLLSSSGKCAIHQISINLSEVISLHCVRGVACARIKSFVVYKNFMLVVLMVVAIAHQFNKNTSEMESFFCTTSFGYYFIFGHGHFTEKRGERMRTRTIEKVWIHLQWGRERAGESAKIEMNKIKMRSSDRIWNTDACIQNDLRVGLSGFSSGSTSSPTMNSIRVYFVFFFSLSTFFYVPCAMMLLVDWALCSRQKAKVVVESKDRIKLNFGDKTRTMEAHTAYQWHTFLTQVEYR